MIVLPARGQLTRLWYPMHHGNATTGSSIKSLIMPSIGYVDDKENNIQKHPEQCKACKICDMHKQQIESVMVQGPYDVRNPIPRVVLYIEINPWPAKMVFKASFPVSITGAQPLAPGSYPFASKECMRSLVGLILARNVDAHNYRRLDLFVERVFSGRPCSSTSGSSDAEGR